MANLYNLTAKTCPVCGGTERRRTVRSIAWKLFFFSRSYSCRHCHSQYIKLFGVFSLLVERGFVPFYILGSEME